MRDLFNMDEIPTLQAFSLTFHCDSLNLGVLTRKPILAALEACRQTPEQGRRARPEVGGTRGLNPAEPSGGGFPFLPQRAPERLGDRPSKEQEILFTARREEPIEPLSGKSASPDEFLQ
ncbi:hypothetical protein D623_10031133 [Myotis brandtii]|uniref:Uncharacterized protein n=1 Tax=Myotis brandtii TaxID=109478 RepID=S7MHU4_MYOBR|nr:hypothetical protein D623_10031133 [Myotis brandtii]